MRDLRKGRTKNMKKNEHIGKNKNLIPACQIDTHISLSYTYRLLGIIVCIETEREREISLFQKIWGSLNYREKVDKFFILDTNNIR